MKRCVCIILAALMLAGCGNKQSTATTEPEETMNIYQKSNPAEDDRLNILMIGSSYCYYYVEELYGMLEAAGLQANVCNVHYSGCPLEKHWCWWKTGEAHYDYFITNENGRVKTVGTNLEWCLQQQNWDVISLQENTARIFNAGYETHLNTTKVWRTELWDYIKQQFPMSRYLWHQPWARPVGTAFNGIVTESVEHQQRNADQIRNFAIEVCQEQDLERVNTGDAWQVVRQDHGYDNFCARIGSGENNAGDGSHDGDWGGGQYLNACVWFEVITGQSCIGNTYRPVYKQGSQEYTLTEEIITIMQQSAHEAVANRDK